MDENEVGPVGLLKDLWSNKPLFITIVVGLVAVIFIIYKQRQSASPNGTPPATAQPHTDQYTFIEDSYPVFVPTSSSGTGTPPPPVVVPPPPKPPIPIFPPKPPIGNPIPVPKPPPPPPAHTVTVAAWPAQTSTLWGIAQKVYGNGTLWPKIYSANKKTIGSNPNLLHPGQVLTIP